MCVVVPATSLNRSLSLAQGNKFATQNHNFGINLKSHRAKRGIQGLAEREGLFAQYDRNRFKTAASCYERRDRCVAGLPCPLHAPKAVTSKFATWYGDFRRDPWKSCAGERRLFKASTLSSGDLPLADNTGFDLVSYRVSACLRHWKI
jgi:hypothetical protein